MPQSTHSGMTAAQRNSADVEKNDDARTTDVTIKTSDERQNERPREEDEDRFLVRLDPRDDPRNMDAYQKWIIVFVVCCGALCTTCSTSMVGPPLPRRVIFPS